MDKYDLVFDIIENTEKYTSDQLDGLLSDSEIKEIYNLLCVTDSVISGADRPIDVDAEWRLFAGRQLRKRWWHRARMRFGSRAAVITVAVSSSIIAIATGIFLNVTATGGKHEREEEVEPVAANSHANDSKYSSGQSVNTRTFTDGVIIFENETLDDIMKYVASLYDVEVRFNNREVATLRLHYKLDSSLTVNEIVNQLNTFEQINIALKGSVLTID